MGTIRTAVVAAVVAVAGVSCSGDPFSSDVAVPDVQAEDALRAARKLERVGLNAEYDEPAPRGCEVESQRPRPGREVSEGSAVELSLDCAQRDWDEQGGEVWEEFDSGVIDGYADGCTYLFRLSPDGSLYYDDTEYDWDDCVALDPGGADGADIVIPDEVPDDPYDAGYELGLDLGCRSLFESEGVDVLYYGESGFTSSDCLGLPAGGAGRGGEPPQQDAEGPPPMPKVSCGQTSLPNIDGLYEIRVDVGELPCVEALRLIRRYSRTNASNPNVNPGWFCFAGRQGDTYVAGCETPDDTIIVRAYTVG